MPLSNHRNISAIMYAVGGIDSPKNVLDIGAGFGKYGVLLREKLDIRHGRYKKSDWKVTINCVEYYEPYITPLHKYIYDGIFIFDIADIVEVISDYDIILMIDCIEHMNKSKGRTALRKLYDKCNKLFIISFPDKLDPEANAKWPNPRETHRCLWTKEELEEVIGPVEEIGKNLYTKVKA